MIMEKKKNLSPKENHIKNVLNTRIGGRACGAGCHQFPWAEADLRNEDMVLKMWV